jgi:hypothetical protein
MQRTLNSTESIIECVYRESVRHPPMIDFPMALQIDRQAFEFQRKHTNNSVDISRIAALLVIWIHIALHPFLICAIVI